MVKYKLIALDIDGTLTKSDKTISPHTRDTILQAEEQGLKVVIASGRPTYGIAPLADELKLSEYGGYVLAFNGGEITDWTTKEVIYEETLPLQHLPFLYSNAKEYGFETMTYHDDHIVIEDATNQYAHLSSSRNKMRILEVPSFLDEIRYSIHKCMIVGNPDKMPALEQKMQKEINGQLNICRSEPYYMEVTPPHIDKAKCLAILLEKAGIKPEELIACGDSYNDQAMIEYAGLGVAMANAVEPVRNAADYITLSNDEDGIAHVIEKYVLHTR